MDYSISIPRISTVKKLLAEGFSIDDISVKMNIHPAIISHINHKRLSNETSIETITDLALIDKEVDAGKWKQICNDRRQIALHLARRGMKAAQIHVASRMTFYSSRTVIENTETDIDPTSPLKSTIAGKITLSIFVNHYKQIMTKGNDLMISIDAENSDHDELNRVVVAWRRTIEEVNSRRLKEILDSLKTISPQCQELNFDPGFISLGSLFPIAQAVRVNNYLSAGRDEGLDNGYKRFRTIGEAVCQSEKCHARYAYFMTDNEQNESCPFCGLENLSTSARRNTEEKNEKKKGTAG